MIECEDAMETETTGRVLVEALIENLQDVWDVERGMLKPEEVRRIVVSNAIIDSGYALLSLPKRLIDQLGLRFECRKRSRTATGATEVNVYQATRLTIQGRICAAEVVESPDDVPALIGQILLESLDFVVDIRAQKLIGNPAHGGEQIIDLFY
jgi:predicted aspartyl protease